MLKTINNVRRVVNLKMQRKFVAALVAINIFAAVSLTPIAARASRDYTALEDLVNYALSDRNFYSFNVAFGELMKLENGYEKDALLAKLDSITSEVWTKDITDIVHMFEVMANEKSGRTYDALQARIEKSNIKEVEKLYLYNELNSWGRNTVWTPDYITAIDAVVKVWNEKSEASALEADKAISELKVEINKEYIKEMLKEAKVAVGLIPVNLDSKYFDSTANAIYTGDEKNVNIDLSIDKTARTITLKGKYKNLNINAPLATVILEDTEAKEIYLGDVASHSLYLKGNTKVQSLIVNDKSDNAHVVLQGKTEVASAEVKSGVKLEVNTDNDVKNPLGKLVLNADTKKEVELSGDLKTSIVQIQKPVDLKVSANVEKIEVAKEAANTIVTIAKEVKVKEVIAQAAVKVDGIERLEKVTGSASKEVVAYTPPTVPGTGTVVTPGAGGGTSPVEEKKGPAIDTIAIGTASGILNIKPGTTGIIDLSSLVTSTGVKAITSAQMILAGDNSDEYKAGINAVLDFTTSDSLKSYGKEEASLSDAEDMLGIGLQMLSSFSSSEFKKINGTTITLTDASGNTSIYKIVIN